MESTETGLPLEIGVISLFPEMFRSLDYSIPGRAQEQQLLILRHFNPKDYLDHPRARVDDRPYGGGPGMVMRCQPLQNTIDAAQNRMGVCPVIHLSPQGETLTQVTLPKILALKKIILLCSRYEGVDERLLRHRVDYEYSIGDYVVSGGELPAMILIDALTRLLPNALGHPDSAAQDSFQNGLLDYPHYTRPDTIYDTRTQTTHTVPEILQNGHHEQIKRWRLQQSLAKTWQKRPDLLKRRTLTELETVLLDQYKEQQQENGK